VAADPDPSGRRRRLAARLGDLGREALGDAERSLASLELHALDARIRRERRCARGEPLGASPILWVVLRLRRERADLRRINAAVALGLPASQIASQLSVAA
jgi:vacuolar-type H+-ATPase subunit C/Vma6